VGQVGYVSMEKRFKIQNFSFSSDGRTVAIEILRVVVLELRYDDIRVP
jgi:hypothetical protein